MRPRWQPYRRRIARPEGWGWLVADHRDLRLWRDVGGDHVATVYLAYYPELTSWVVWWPATLPLSPRHNLAHAGLLGRDFGCHKGRALRWADRRVALLGGWL